jgi:hypothetical protein
LCVFYEGSKPRTLVAGALEVAKAPGGGSRRNATTHGVVIEAAKTHLSHIAAFSQDIGSVHPLDWIREKREEANYGHSRFSEPEAPVHMKILERYGIRQLVGAYLADTTLTYPFDPDHAMLAYNLLLWRFLWNEIKHSRYVSEIADDDLAYLRSLFVDRTGPLGPVQRLLQRED